MSSFSSDDDRPLAKANGHGKWTFVFVFVLSLGYWGSILRQACGWLRWSELLCGQTRSTFASFDERLTPHTVAPYTMIMALSGHGNSNSHYPGLDNLPSGQG